MFRCDEKQNISISMRGDTHRGERLDYILSMRGDKHRGWTYKCKKHIEKIYNNIHKYQIM